MSIAIDRRAEQLSELCDHTTTLLRIATGEDAPTDGRWDVDTARALADRCERIAAVVFASAKSAGEAGAIAARLSGTLLGRADGIRIIADSLDRALRVASEAA